ncbi:MAG: M23 family metallopeptidase [Candidatus Bathyarchaeia archaeon]
MKNVISICLLFLLVTVKSWAEPFLNLPLKNSARISCDFCCYKFRNGACHSGIDYGVRNNTEVIAAAAGIVDKVIEHHPSSPDRQAGYGNYVRIRHSNGYWTIYAHLAENSIYVSEGDNIVAGQVLGLSDNSGYSTGPHLHFEVRDPNGKKVNPYGDNPDYPNCGPNALWATCPPF